MIERQSRESMDSVELLRRVAAGDDQAATDIFERYAERLTALARSRLSAKLASRVDPEDIVQSAYRSFFVAAGHGQFEIHGGGDLWRLLVEMTLHKLYRTAQHHLAQQRSVSREQRNDASRDLVEFLVGREPTPEEAVAAVDELQAVFSQLNNRDRHAVELRLQGFEHEEIATQMNCNERTVRRAVNQARRLIAARGGNGFVPSAARQSITTTPPHHENIPVIAADDATLHWTNYVLREQIGAGAFGRVYRATQKSDGRDFAIKFLRKSLATNAAAMRRFLAEAKTVSSLVHTGIVPVYGVGTTPGGGLFLLMDLLRGPNLEQVSHSGALTIADALKWIAQAAEALHFAHASGIIHCDLKPSNILLDASNRARITDFGFALRRDEVSDNLTRLAGTPAFMAPEQVDQRWGKISPLTDIWGLGSVLFYLLFGRPPHEGCDIPTTLANVATTKPVTFPEVAARPISLAVREIVAKCLSKEPNQRVESAAKLALLLKKVVKSLD